MTSILVIDDEYGVRSGIRQILELEGYAVEVAETGREALAFLDQRPFDIALINYQLPDVDGLTLLATMRSRKLATMTCMITAYANIDTAIAATRQGIDFFLPKPFSPDDLLGVIETGRYCLSVCLNCERTRNRLNGAGKLGQKSIPHDLEKPAGMTGNIGFDDVAP